MSWWIFTGLAEIQQQLARIEARLDTIMSEQAGIDAAAAEIQADVAKAEHATRKRARR